MFHHVTKLPRVNPPPSSPTLGELGWLSPAPPVNPMLDYLLLLFSFAMAKFRLLSVRFSGPGRRDPAGFFDPFGFPPGMETSPVPCETSSSKAKTALSTGIIPAFPYVCTQPHAAHLVYSYSQVSKSRRASCAADWLILTETLMGTLIRRVYG